MSELVGRMQTQFKKTYSDLLLFSAKFFSGATVGLTIALITEVMLGNSEGENWIVFVFVIALVTAMFLRLAKTWSLTAVLVFDLICVLAGMLLRLYILVAPDL